MVKQPVYFFGHGSPMIGIEENDFTHKLSEIGKTFTEKPKAIMVISAHWLTDETFASVSAEPETIYDFGGFPEELYKVKYPAAGSPEAAREIIKLIPEIRENDKRGLDHGAWTILKYLFPEADVPVFQLSVDYTKPLKYHFDLGQKLKAMREKDLLIIGSGNIVHNLRAWFSRANDKPFDWAIEFDEWVKNKIIERDFKSLINYETQGYAAKMSVPTVDHYVPMLYCLGLAGEEDKIEFIYEKVESSLSMRSFRVG